MAAKKFADSRSRTNRKKLYYTIGHIDYGKVVLINRINLQEAPICLLKHCKELYKRVVEIQNSLIRIWHELERYAAPCQSAATARKPLFAQSCPPLCAFASPCDSVRINSWFGYVISARPNRRIRLFINPTAKEVIEIDATQTEIVPPLNRVLKSLRWSTAKTIKEFSEEFPFSRNYITEIENGKNVSAKVLDEYINYFGLDRDSLEFLASGDLPQDDADLLVKIIDAKCKKEARKRANRMRKEQTV